ncbi:hypothetical protein PF004_g9101 [Phytophthora fragariae]|nr:hypothetical protein PF004_g9101 [Phytophthora fragariae]
MDQVPALQTFDLEENQIGSDGITSFFHCINGMIAPFPLRYLHLGGNSFASKTVLEQIHTKLHEKIIETQLSAGPAATVLNISGNKVKRDILLECCLADRYVHIVTQTLRASPNWHLLEVLDMSGNEIGEKGAYDVGLFLALQPQLRVLNLSNNLITDAAILGLAEGLEPNAKLQELLLDLNQITDAGAKELYLKAFKANQQRRIKLSVGNPLTSECKVMLAAISQAHDLRKRFIKEFASQEKLELSGRALRQYGAAAIAEELAAAPSSKCRIIDFSRNGLGDEGAQAIAQLLRAYPLLEELDLSFNDIGDDGVIVLADALSENATLMSLSLHSALEGSQVKLKLQEKGLCYLAQAIQGHKALVKLDLRNNVTSPAVIRAYVEMLRRNQGIQKFNGTSAAVFLSSSRKHFFLSHTIWITMTNFRRFWRRAYRFCVSFQVELRGHYSPERIGNFDDYCCKTSAHWSFIVCVLSPFPCLLIVAALDCVPMAPPKEGSEANYLFWIRDCLAITLMTRAILEQFRVSVPDLHINAVHVIVMPMIAGGCAVLFMTAMSSVIGFPLPFALVVGIPVWFVVVVICFACCFGQKLRRDPVLFKDLQNSIVVLIFQVLLTFVYPAYLYGFNRVKASNQKFYLVLLPIIKIIAKNLISHNLGTKYDLMPQIMIFNVDVFNALIPAEHPLKSASFIQIAQQIIKEDFHAKANLMLHRYNSAFSILKYPARGSVDSHSSVGALTDTTQMVSKKILPVDTTGAPLPVAEVETFTPLHHDESTQRCGVLKDVFSPRERRLFVQRTAQVLFTTEFVILVEYTEVIVPFIFCIYTLSMYYLPNRAYYPQLAARDESGLRSKLSTVTMFGAVELLSLLVYLYGFIIQRKIGVSMLRMLSFVLDRGWRIVQSNLFLWIFYTVQNSLEHNGADFS